MAVITQKGLLLLVAQRLEGAKQERLNTTQIPTVKEEEERQDVAEREGKTARCYPNRQKNREKRAERPGDGPVSTKYQVGELNKGTGRDWWLNKTTVSRLKRYIKWGPLWSKN